MLPAICCALTALLAGCARVPAAPPRATLAAVKTNAKVASVDGVSFEEVAGARGITYQFPKQPRPLRNIEAFGAGCAFLDYDDDGWMDVLLVSSPFPHLYRNRRDGTFEDVTARVGLDRLHGMWTGCAVGDYDGNGTLDLALTGYHCFALLRNEVTPMTGHRQQTAEATANPQSAIRNPQFRHPSSVIRHFRDVTRAAGFDPANRGRWGSSAAFMDLDSSGRLALIKLNYVIMGPHEKQYCELRPGVLSGCPPSVYRPEYPELWQNLGNGRFRDVTAGSGMDHRPGRDDVHGKSLVVAFNDINDDGRMDFYIGNDGTPAELMLNLGGLKFRNVGADAGVALASTSHAIAAMGADWGDYDRDGRLDLAVSAFSDEVFSLLRCAGTGQYVHTEEQVGIAGATLKPLGFGTKWLDMDNDGWPDLVFANGHVYDNVDAMDPFSTFRQPLMLFHNEAGAGGRVFRDLTPLLGGDIARPLLGRGTAVGDFDNDGREDYLAVDYEGAPVLLHNVSRTPNHWVTFDLRQRGANRYAYGAKVTARAGKDVWEAFVAPASSYLSSSDPRIHFGLGPVTKLDTVTVRWPEGGSETWRNVPCDRILRVEKGRPPAPAPYAAGATVAR